jgi:hypothetical protein
MDFAEKRLFKLGDFASISDFSQKTAVFMSDFSQIVVYLRKITIQIQRDYRPSPSCSITMMTVNSLLINTCEPALIMGLSKAHSEIG